MSSKNNHPAVSDQLFLACANGQGNEVLDLLERGIDPDNYYYIEHDGLFPLHIACMNNNFTTAKYLLKWGANIVSFTDDSKDTPLHRACCYNRMDCVKLLMEHNSPTGIENEYGFTAVHLAKQRGYNDIAEFITEYNCPPADPLSSYPSAKQLSELKVNQWYKLGLQLDLNKAQLEILKESAHPTTAICMAAKKKNIDLKWKHIVESLLHIGEFQLAESVCSQEGKGYTTLAVSAFYGWLDIVKHLVDIVGLTQKASWSSSNVHVIYEATVNGHLKVAEYLIGKKLCDIKDIMILACANGHLDTIKYLVEFHHCDPSCVVNKIGDTPISVACANGHLDIVKYLLKFHYCDPHSAVNKAGQTPLFLAYSNRHLETVKYLTQEQQCDPNFEVNKEGDTPLSIECSRGNLEMVKALINKHVDPKKIVNKAKAAPLSLACASGDLDTIKYLVEVHHCDPKSSANKSQPDQTPILQAYKGGHREVVKYLANTHDCDTKDCLLHAVQHGNNTNVRYLLEEFSSNPNVTDMQGRTPLELATKSDIAKRLLKHGAQAKNVYKAHNKLIGKLSSERPPDNPLPVFITGDGGVGKSTMLKSMMSSKGFKAIFVKARPVTGVDKKTVGIIPQEIVTKEFGRVICYDFAGQQEFYASHCAVLENAVQISPPIIIYLAHLEKSEQEIYDSTARWMTLVQNQCSNLTDKAHVIVVGSHADIVIERGENPRDKESMFAPIIKKFSKLEFIAFTPMDCRYADSASMKEIKKQIQQSSATLRSPITISLNAHTFYIYLIDSFKDELAITIKEVNQEIHSDLFQTKTQSKRMRSILSFIPTTISRLVEICEQLNKMGLVLYLHNESSPEKSFIVCDRVTLLSNITGTVFAPENFRQHCSLASSTGVVPLSKFIGAFQEYNIEMLIAFMSHLELCFEIADNEVLSCAKKLDGSPDPDSRYLFFPGLIRIDIPEKVWEEDSRLSYHFGWIIQTSHNTEFFDPRCFQVLILRLVFAFDLAPAAQIQQDLPSLQRSCSVWKNGICWCSDDGVTSHLELLDNNKSFVLKMRSISFCHNFLAYRAKIISKVLETVTDFCCNVSIVESVIDSKQVIQHPLQSSSGLTLFNINDFARAVLAKKDLVKSVHLALPIKHIVKFEPYAGLDQDTLQCIHSEKNALKNKKISNAFIFHFANQILHTGDGGIYMAILNPYPVPSAPGSRSIQELIHTLKIWRSETEGTYSCLRETLNKYSIFTGRNPLNLSDITHKEIDPSIFPEPTLEDFLPESGPDLLPFTSLLEATINVRLDWYSLAVELDINYETRQAIEKDYSSVDTRFKAMLKLWVKRTSPPPSWSTLIKALQSPAIEGGKKAAEKINTLPEVTEETTDAAPSTHSELFDWNDPLNIDKHLKVVREAIWVVRPKWYNFGMMLGIQVDTLKVFQQNYHHIANACFTSILENWLNHTSPKPTWTVLIEALKSPVINRDDIASKVEAMTTSKNNAST